MYEKTRSFRHDYENHLSVIQGLLNEKRNGEALKYLTEIKSNTDKFSYPANTGIASVDMLLKNKLGYATELGIKIRCDLTLPADSKISDTDLCIIIANALDNAINACGELSEDTNKSIKISSKIQDKLLVLEFRNTYNGAKSFKEGTGIKNIRTACGKYNGTVQIITGNH